MNSWIIDPPVTPYSSAEDIRAWISELESMPDSEAKTDALRLARLWLVSRESQAA